VLAASRRLDRRLRELLLREARRQGLPAHRLAEAIEEATGSRMPREWDRLERLLLDTDELDARELAAVLVELGVRVPEDEWLRIVSSYSLASPRKPR
jgi:hypothetical protein